MGEWSESTRLINVQILAFSCDSFPREAFFSPSPKLILKSPLIDKLTLFLLTLAQKRG